METTPPRAGPPGAPAYQRPAYRREDGFALLLVLLTLGFLALIATRELADARLEAGLALAAQARAQDDASLDAATQTTLFHLLTLGNAAWARNGQHTLSADGNTAITVLTRALDERIPLNFAGPTLLAGLLQACRVQPDRALPLANAIIAWRDPSAAREAASDYRDAVWAPSGAPFRAIGDLALVRGVTPALLRCIGPHLSVYQHDPPTRRSPDPVVRQAIVLSQGAAQATVPTIDGQSTDARTGGAQDDGSPPNGPPNGGAPPPQTPLIGGASDPVVRIDLTLSRGPVHRHLALVAGLATASDPRPYALLARRADAADDLR